MINGVQAPCVNIVFGVAAPVVPPLYKIVVMSILEIQTPCDKICLGVAVPEVPPIYNNNE